MAILKHTFGTVLPLLLVFIFVDQLSAWDFSNARELVKISGLVAEALITITFLVGPVSKFIKPVNSLKVFRKYWGIMSFLFVCVHVFLAYWIAYNRDIQLMFSWRNPYHTAFYFGFFSFLYFFLMFITSNRISMQKMGGAWKWLQTGGYVALVFALFHILLLEVQNGQLLETRVLGQATIALAIISVMLRLIVVVINMVEKDEPEPDLDVL